MAVPREITRIEVPEPEPMHQTPEGGAETQGAAYRLSAPAVATEPLAVTAPDGTALTWVPTELCYRDKSGQMDYIVGSAPASVHVRDREARYQRTFPVADDVFLAEAERVKHWVILHEPPREPAEYLSGAIEFGVTGIVSGVTLPEGRHDEIESGPFWLPKPVARDLAGREIEGYYEVVPAEGGQQLFVWFPADAILRAVYPVTIDPTIRSSGSGFATSFDNGIALAADGAYYALVLDTSTAPYLFVYRTSDRGQTWQDTGFPGAETSSGMARRASIIATTDGLVRVFFADIRNSTLGIYQSTYDGTQWSQPALVEAVGGLDEVIARAGPNGEIHLVWRRSYFDGVTTRYDLVYKRYAGGQWKDSLALVSGGTSKPYPSAAVSGQTVVVTLRSVDLAFVSVDGGQTFTSYDIENAWPSDRYGHAFVDGAGTIHIVYWSDLYDILVRQWTGAGFSAPEVVANESTLYDVVGVAAGEALVVIWSKGDLQYAVKRDGVWSSAQPVVASGATRHDPTVPQLGESLGFPVVWREGSGSPYTVQSETISLDRAPNAPILDQRENFDATQAAIFSWTFSDPDAGDAQTAYQLIIKRSDSGAVVYDTGKVASGEQQHTLPAGTLTNGVQYRWTVRTWDLADAPGPYAEEQSFLTSAKPNATITDPASDGATVSTSSYTIRWSISDPESKGQSAYRVMLKDGGGNVVHDSGKVLSTTARAYTLQNLQNNTSYTIELTVWDGDGVASAVVTRTIQVQYTPPPTPDVTVEALEAWVRITIANNNAGAEIQAVSNDVYRRKVGEAGNGIRIATNVPVDGVVYDYAVASGVAYEYRVVAMGENGTTSASAWVQAPVLKLTGAWIHDPADPANTIRRFRVAADRSENWEPAAETFQFAGRKYPVAEFGEQTDQRVKTAIIVLPDSLADLHALRRLAELRTVLCYRDSAGRRIFGVLGPLSIRDERHGGYTVEIEIQAVDYDEAV